MGEGGTNELSRDFRFSQTSLQDYVDCPRRFQLRYVEAQPWPAVQSQPVLDREHHLDLGARFHRLVERHQLGLDPDLLGRMVDDPQLLAWWSAYLELDYLHAMEGVRLPEFRVSVDLGGHRIVVVYDLLVLRPDGRAVIFDWKTYRWTPSAEWFFERVQSRLYPSVLALAAQQGIFEAVVGSDQVSLVYWIVGASGGLIELAYSDARFQEDLEYISSILEGVDRGAADREWSKTGDVARCRLCEYRSFCGRDVEVGMFDQFGNDDDNAVREGLVFWDYVFEVGF
jgi:hypothetical protein